ncbi:isoprenoid synthase domain-containing protein [Gautieria morchelliformis]|nr:isoprenoid synthase domain-containing protein [Gautieria morchelliformis]
MASSNDISATRLDSYFVSSPSTNIISSILRGFLNDMAHNKLEMNATNQQLEDAMRADMEAGNFACDQLERTLHLAASLIEWAYHDRSFAEKKNIALYNWYLIYVDDMAPKDPSSFCEFEQRFLTGRPQLNPILDALVSVLLRMWDLYDPLCANSIIAATFEFVTSSCLEPDIERLPLIRGTERFSWFVRERTGVATAFALMAFTKSTKIDLMEFIQAIPDINFWICLTNDILSFHKEELGGETGTYVHNRAYLENKAPLQVLAEMAEELRISRNTIHTALSNSPTALLVWEVFERGYVAWHIAQDRYRLKDLDL